MGRANAMLDWVLKGTALFVLSLMAWPAVAEAGQENLIEYIRDRDDLSRSERTRWERAVRLSFGGSALDAHTKFRPELGVAKAILSVGIFMQVNPKDAARAAREGWTDVQKFVPPPIAIHYWRMALEGRKPRGRPADLAFRFPEYYNEEIAPDLVAYWEQALRDGKIPDYALRETKEALEATRVKMRPLLVDKLRLLARLEFEASKASRRRARQIARDKAAVEAELKAAFTGVARRSAVLDARRSAYDRLRMQLEDMGQRLTADDQKLKPARKVPPPPPPRKVTPPPPPPRKVTPPPPPPRKVTPPPPTKREPSRIERQRSTRTKPPSRQTRLRQLRATMVEYAQRLRSRIAGWLGTPYRWGGETKRVGTDCSGFTQGLFKEEFRIALPRVSRDQYRMGYSVSRRNLRPGDLVFFDTLDQGRITHVGVYVGKGQFAHASSSKGVTYAKLKLRYFRRAYRGARRVLSYP